MSTYRPFLLIVAILLAGLLTPPVPAAPPKKPTPSSVRPQPGALRPQSLAANEYLPTSKLKPGMKGYGLTVFKGAKIERFDVTVLGVLKKANNGKDLILVRMKGGPLTKRYATVVSGMSGSPVYVNGRIIGAYAYAPEFLREPLGLLTPIEDMLEVWDPDLPQSPMTTLQTTSAAPAYGEHVLPASVTIGGKQVRRVRFAAPGEWTSRPGESVRENGVLTLVPLATPIAVSGMPASKMPALAKALAPFGLRPMQMPGGATLPAHAKGSPLQPGGAIAVSLATGDFDYTAFGTLTYRRGNKIVAFGHPFMGIGPIDAPMYSAYIHDILPSYSSSFKLGSSVNLVGRVFQDRPFSIGGQIGVRPVMIPVSVRIDDRSTRRRRNFNAKIIRHPLLTPALASIATQSAITEVHGQPGDSMARVSLEVEAEEVGKITRSNTFFDAMSIGETATADLVSLLGTLTSNPFYPVGVRSIKMNVIIEPRRDTAQIERIFLKQTRFEPGETVDVGVVIKPYKRARVVRNISVRIPATTTPGTLALLVQGGGFAGLSLVPGPGGGLTLRPGSDTGSAANIKQLVRRFEEREKNNDLVARLLLPTAAVSVGGEKLTGLPPAIADVMRSTRSTGLRLERDEVKVVEGTQYVLSGLQALTVRVAKKGAPERPTLTAPPPGSESSPPSAAPPGAASITSLSTEDDDMAALAARAAQATIAVEADDDPDDEEEPEIVPPVTRQPAAAAGAARTPPAAVKPGGSGSAADTGIKPAADAKTTSADADKPVGRLPGVWQQSTAADFRAGTLDGVTVTSLGDVRLAPTLRKVAESNEAYFWSLAPAENGGVYAGTGDNGLIYKIDANGRRTEFARTGELMVHALVRAADGTLYAGTSPNGRVLKIGADGKVTPLFKADEKYVLALALAPDGTLYAATGGTKGRIYRIARTGGKQVVYEGAEAHITALALGADGTLYAGTAPGGLVVKIEGQNKARPVVLYDAPESSITGLAVDKTGNVYAGTAPRGMLYKITPSATARVLYDKAPAALAGLQADADGAVWFASGAAVYSVLPDETVRSYDAPSDIQILSLMLAPDGKVWASTGNIGAVYALGGAGRAGASLKGTLVSSVFDAKSPAQWGTVRWTASLPKETQLLLETRSGDVAEPDSSWSPWSAAVGSTPNRKVASPAGRYLQYRVTLTGGNAAATTSSSQTVTATHNTLALRAVEVFYLTRNQPPTVAISAPRPGEVWRGTKMLRWSGSDPDKDTLSFVVELSSDGGRTWTAARTGGGAIRTITPIMPPAATAASRERDMLASMRAELDKHPEISAETRERLLRDAPDAIRAAIASSREPAAAKTGTPAGTRSTSLSLDTTRWPDGTYLLRIVASDAAANPQEPLTAERVSAEFRIVNRSPEIAFSSPAPTVAAERTARIEGTASHPLVGVRAVQYRVDGGDWMAAVATDGLFDSPVERFTLTTLPLTPGAHTIEVQGQDEAGNTATQKTTVTIR